MSITPRVLKEMAAGMAEGPLRTAKTIPLADALFDAAERIEHLDAENARLRESLQMIADEAWHSNDGTRAEYCHPEGCESPGIARATLAGEEKKS